MFISTAIIQILVIVFYKLRLAAREYYLNIVNTTLGVISLAALLLLGLHFYTGPFLQSVNSWDFAIMVDGGWRILNGQIPHADFAVPHGMVVFLIFAQGLKIWGLEYENFLRFLTFLSAGMGLITFLILRRRVETGVALIFSFLLLCLMLGVNRIDGTFYDSTSAMVYNRIGWATLAVLLAMLKPQIGHRSQAIAESLFFGAVLGLTLFIKINFFAGGILIYFLALFYNSEMRSLKAVAQVFVGFCIVLIMVVSYLKTGIFDYFTQFKGASEAHTVSDRLQFLGQNVKACLPDGFFGVGLLAIVCCINPNQHSPLSLLRKFLTVLVTLGIGLFVQMGNMESGVMILVPFTILLLFSNEVVIKAKNRKENYACFIALWLSVLAFAPWILQSYRSVFHATAKKVQLKGSNQFAFEGYKNSRGLILGDFLGGERNEIMPPLVYKSIVKGGLDILSNHTHPKDKTLVFSFANPFDFLLARSPVKNNPICWDVGHLINQKKFSFSDVNLEDANFILVSKQEDRLYSLFKNRNVSTIHSLRFIAENKYWSLWKKLSQKEQKFPQL